MVLTLSALSQTVRLANIQREKKIVIAKSILPNLVLSFIKTKMGDNISHFFAEGHDEKIGQMHPLGLGEPEDVANAIAFLLSDLSKWITGSIMNVDGGFTAI